MNEEIVDPFDYEPEGHECHECGERMPPGLCGLICPLCDYDNHFEGW